MGLTHGGYGDCPHSQPPLTAEDNFDPECAEEGLCRPQSACECGGLFGQPDRLNPSIARLRTSAPSSLTLSEPHARLGVIEKFNS